MADTVIIYDSDFSPSGCISISENNIDGHNYVVRRILKTNEMCEGILYTLNIEIPSLCRIMKNMNTIYLALVGHNND